MTKGLRADHVERHNKRSYKGQFLSAYDPKIVKDIIEYIAQGDTIGEACKRSSKFPTKETFRKWLTQHPEDLKAFKAAREMSAFSLEEEALEGARGVSKNPSTTVNVRAKEVLLNQLRWSASRRNPREFAEKSATSVVVPVQINTTLDLGDGSGEIKEVYELPPVEVKVLNPFKRNENDDELAKG